MKKIQTPYLIHAISFLILFILGAVGIEPSETVLGLGGLASLVGTIWMAVVIFNKKA